MSDAGRPPDVGAESLLPRDSEPVARVITVPPLRMPPDIPDLLTLGGPEAIEDYREVFARVFLRGLPPVDPGGCVIVFDRDACDHICYHHDRFDQRRKRAQQELQVRDFWDQERAEHILWLWPALTAPSLIVRNNQVRGNLVYLLGFPTGNTSRPDRRYYVSVRPLDDPVTRVRFKTAYPINQRQWDAAMRGRPGTKHVLYRGNSPRW
jgi:hypothetical protein